MKKYLLCGAAIAVLSLGACRSEERSSALVRLSGLSPSASPAPGPGGEAAPQCAPYPLTLTFAPAEAEARAELEAFAPGATLWWSAARATPSNIFGLSVTLACEGDVYDALLSVVESHPALFRIARDEWASSGPAPCSMVSDNQQILSLVRSTFAELYVRKDKVSFLVRRSGDDAVLTGVVGFYLPRATHTQVALLGSCGAAATTALEATAQAGSYEFQTYNFCTPSGGGTYTPTPADSVELDELVEAVWDETPNGIKLRLVRRGRLLIAEENLTPELMASNVYCGSDVRAGFSLTFDNVTGELLYGSPGVDGCVVC